MNTSILLLSPHHALTEDSMKMSIDKEAQDSFRTRVTSGYFEVDVQWFRPSDVLN